MWTPQILSTYAFLFQRTDYRAFTQSWRDLRNARVTLGEISAQDEFAKWAKQQRVVDRLQAEFDKQSTCIMTVMS